MKRPDRSHTARLVPGKPSEGGFERFLEQLPEPRDDAERYSQRRALERYRQLTAGKEPEGSESDSPPFRPSRLKKYRGLLHEKARALLERGSIEIETNGRYRLQASIHRFPDGTAVLETEYPRGSHGIARLEPEHFVPEVIAAYLEHAFLNARVRPVADQPI